MRVLALFFACYFAVLGCLPCADAKPCAEPAHAAVARATHQDCGRQRDAVDWCSPLCQCQCCASFALPTAPAVAFASPPAVAYPALRFAAQRAAAMATRAPAAPWQPPQGA